MGKKKPEYKSSYEFDKENARAGRKTFWTIWYRHSNIHKWGLQNCSINENYICPDIGCGGGNAVKAIAEAAIKEKIF
ncbi:MAG: hypothetical protein K8S62_10020 [Candidatus Sabulitectum sp.]|nr:hypothetical protein [Candidatus Sabulitectum sp.]